MAEQAAALAPVEELLWEQDVPAGTRSSRSGTRYAPESTTRCPRRLSSAGNCTGHGTDYPWRLLRARREEARGQEWPVH